MVGGSFFDRTARDIELSPVVLRGEAARMKHLLGDGLLVGVARTVISDHAEQAVGAHLDQPLRRRMERDDEWLRQDFELGRKGRPATSGTFAVRMPRLANSIQVGVFDVRDTPTRTTSASSSPSGC